MSITAAQPALSPPRVPTFASRLRASLKYVFTMEVHVYAFAIAANVLLSFIPFMVLLLTLFNNVLHWPAATDALIALLQDALPSNQEFITRNLKVLARSHKTQLVSLAMLLFTSTGVLLPLEVALNRLWGIRKDRSFLMNQVVSYGLAFACGILALLSIMLTAAGRATIMGVFGWLGWTQTAAVLSYVAMKIIAVPATILIFFMLYYFMPHGKLPIAPNLRAAVIAGLLMEAAKYVFIWVLPWLNLPEVYGPFYRSVTLVLWSFFGAMVLLGGAHLAAGGRNIHCEPAARNSVR